VQHDPTTAVDAVTEAAIADGVRRLRAGRHTVIVTRSPALLQVADRVVTLTPEPAVTPGAPPERPVTPEHAVAGERR
jgi:putative ABC transport system ATP-binding protein